MRARDDARLHFKILTYGYQEATAVALQDYWKRIGVSSELNVVEITSSNQLMFDGNFDVATYCSCGQATGDVGGQLRAHYYSNVVSNFGRYSNPDVDRLIDQISQEFDQTRQFELARRAQELILEDVPIIYAGNAEIFSVIFNKRIQGMDTARARNLVPSMFVAAQ